MAEIFNYEDLQGGKVFSQPQKESELYDFKELEETKEIKSRSAFSLVYGQEKKVEAKKILEEAKQLSHKILEEAKNKVSEIEKAAYDKGYSKGESQAFEDGKEKLEPIMTMFQQNLEKIFVCQKEIYSKSEEEMLNLTLALASRIIHQEVRTNKDVIIGTINAAINKIISREQVTIRINSDDMEYVLQNKPKLSDDLNNIQQVSFKEDSSVSKGGCIIDTNFGSIRAILEKEFGELEKQLKKEFAASKEMQEHRE